MHPDPGRTALAAFLILAVPVWDLWFTRRLRRSTDPRRKMRAYLVTMGWLWAASAVVWAMLRPGFLYPLRWAARPGWAPGPEFAAGVCAAFIAGSMVPVALAWRSARARESVGRAIAKLRFILPGSPGERRLFATVSVTAGICEETIYRGFLIQYWAVDWHLGLVAALLVSAAIFGLGHGYQGIQGVVGTAAMGAVLGLLYIVSGSLLLAMVLHALVDLRVLLFPRQLMVENGENPG